MDFGNTCAIIFRLVLLILLVYGIVLSVKVMYSCHFLSAVSPNGESHGVGLLSFETKDGSCIDHNSFVVENYNGMELTARVAGYVAPSLGALSALHLLFECFKGLCLGGKCIPALTILLSSVCQGLTFLLFQSDLFCGNTDVISECDVGKAGYQSIQSCLVYAFCLVLYFCGPTPEPLKMGHGADKKTNTTPSKSSNTSSSSLSSPKVGESEKNKKKKSEPGKGEDWTREMYEQRRKEKKSKSRGVSGRSKEEIFDDLHDSGRANGKRRSKSKSKRKKDRSENTMVLYEQNNKNRRKKGDSERGSEHSSRSRSQSQQERFDDYVDTDPDGMDWSAFTPVQREAYYERQRIKKKERREREREREVEKLREWEEQVDRRRGDRSRSPIRNEADYSHGSVEYDDTYYGPGIVSRYGDDGGHSYYSERNEGSEYDIERHQQYNRPGEGRGGGGDSVDDRRSHSRSVNDNYSYADYSYDDYTYDDYTYDDDTLHESEYSYSQSQDPPTDHGGYYYDQASQHSSRRSRANYYT